MRYIHDALMTFIGTWLGPGANRVKVPQCCICFLIEKFLDIPKSDFSAFWTHQHIGDCRDWPIFAIGPPRFDPGISWRMRHILTVTICRDLQIFSKICRNLIKICLGLAVHGEIWVLQYLLITLACLFSLSYALIKAKQPKTIKFIDLVL